MRRVAANIVYINNIEFYKNHIVELYEHIVVNHYKLVDELAMTEWFSGTIVINKNSAYLIKRILTQAEVDEIYSLLSSSSEFCTNDSCSYCDIERL